MAISVVILTFNSEATLAQTLASVRAVSDDIHIVDSFSTDRTLEIAQAAGTRIVQHEFARYDLQRNWAIASLDLRHSWELHLDADERLSLDLAAAIKRLAAHFPSGIDGYMIPRLTHFLGRPIRHGGMYPNWHLRLFRRGRGRCETRLYDQHFIVDGKIATIAHPMIDDVRLPLAEWSRRHLRWTDYQVAMALDQREQGEVRSHWRGTPIERKRALRGFYGRAPLLLRPFLLFLYRYVVRLGFLDGIPGLIFFVLQTFWFHFLIDARIYERRLAPSGTAASAGADGDGRP
jgi:glycosyltransferase involved in cell wall biosynthesis